MFIFTNAFNDCLLLLFIITIVTQIVIPLFKNKKMFPLFRKLIKLIANKARWEQESIKAQQVTLAEQNKEVAVKNADRDKEVSITNAKRDRDVADLQRQAAEFTKAQQIALGEGESKRMQLVMQANGALEQKLKTYKEVMSTWANALGNFKGSLVPAVMMGGGGNANQNSAATLIDMLNAKTAKDLALDMSVPNTNSNR